MAIVGRAIIQKQNSDAKIERETIAIKKITDWRTFKFEWQKKQTDKAVQFPSYGWVPRSAIAWRKPDGLIVCWSCGYQDTDEFLIAGWLVDKNGLVSN